MQASRTAPLATAARFLCALVMAALCLAQGLDAAPQALAAWNGEYFDQKQGGLYVNVALKGFKASQQTSYITTDVQIEVFDLLKRKTYMFSHKLQDVTKAPRQLFKLPSGKYLVKSIVMVDAAGVKRLWRPKKLKRTFAIKRLCISNLGIWTIAPVGKDGLKVRFDSAANTYNEGGKKADSSVVAVIDGFNGLIQKTFAGKRLLDSAKSGYEGRGEMRAAVTFTRQIAMYYKLDLFKHNYHGKAVATVLSVYDPNMRTCYTNRLEFNEKLKGEVKFTFLLSKRTGTMAKLKYSGGTANDPKLVECLYHELGRIQFPVPDNMIGELTYTYEAR